MRCVDTAVKGSNLSKDTAVHEKFVTVARDCRNTMMTFFNQQTQENVPGSGIREIKTGRNVEDVLNAIQESCWAKWGPAKSRKGPIQQNWVCIVFEVFKKFGPELIGGSGETFFATDARQFDNTEAGNRKNLRTNKQAEHANKRAKQVLHGLSGTSA